MFWRRSSLLVASGSLALAASLGVRHWTHGTCSDFGIGFLFGVSVALMIVAFAWQSRRISR